MQSHTSASPITLSYVAALRGVKPRLPGEAFIYADVNCTDTDLLTCLAASNPEGKFIGVVADQTLATQAEEQAKLREVENVAFVLGALGSVALPPLNYLCCDETKKPLSAVERNALFGLAEAALAPGGLLNLTYRAVEGDSHLRFLVREFAPEMDGAQAKEFLAELKKLGSQYFAQNPQALAQLNEAIAKGQPDEFFSLYDKGEARSASFNTLVALRPRGFSYAGDTHMACNYIELSVPSEAQDLVIECQNNPLYESIKDFVRNRDVRSDIWCRQPAEQSSSLPELFGGFTYGITKLKDEVPSSIDVLGKTVDLSTPLYRKLIELMTLMPVGIGDFMAHPSGEGFSGTDIVGAMQILVALGIAQPMRGVLGSNDVSNVSQPRLVGGFNQYLDKVSVTGGNLWMASSVAGNAMSISARDALVIQALSRAGLANSVSALMPELERLAQNPAQAAKIMDAAQPTPEMARDMVQDIVGKSIVQWYAYGLLEAA
ncbi:MAG: methyltransferase regulatory domain-containing protein [Alphaproteobacteria bacterium]